MSGGIVEPDRPEVRCAGEPQRRRAGVGQPGERRFEVRGEVVAQEPPGAHEELGVARADDVGELGRRRQGADRGDERADAERGVERRQQQRAVGCEHADAGPLAGAAREQRLGHAGRAPVELGVGEGLVGDDQRRVVRSLPDDLGEQLREGRRVAHVRSG